MLGMKKSITLGLALSLCFLVATATNGKEKNAMQPKKIAKEALDIGEKTPPNKIDWEKRTKFGSSGNVTVYLNDDGTPREVYVVGVAPVSTTLIAVEAEQDAMEEAEYNAMSAFAYWMKTNLVVKNTREKKILIVRKNGKEISESVTISKRKAVKMAKATWRGMSIFWHKRSNGRYISVWRWSVTEQKIAKMVEMLTQDGDPDSLKRKTDMNVKDIKGTFR